MKPARLLSLKLLAITLFIGTMTLCLVPSDTAAQKDDDLTFLKEASRNSAWKMAMGEVAIKQAAGTSIREYGRKMMTDHERIHRELKALADKKGAALPAGFDKPRENTLQFLSKEYGAAFDRSYMSLVMDDNQEDAALYRAEANNGKDADIKAFATALLKQMEEYVRGAENILRDIPQPFLK